MGQQPNIELDMSDLPRPTAHPAPARRWSPRRPGDLAGPQDVPSGGAFGTTGPDQGYAHFLAKTRSLDVGPADDARDARDAVAVVATARAARFGKAPSMGDIDLAAVVLGYDHEGIPDAVLAELAARRAPLVAGVGHSAPRAAALVARVPDDVLGADAAAVRSRLAAGEIVLGE